MLRLLITAAVLLAPAVASAQVKVVIDAGHGGTDPGGTGTGMQEKVIVLDVSKRFKALLEADTADTNGGGKWTALLTRSNDTFVSLAARSAYSNNQDADRRSCFRASRPVSISTFARPARCATSDRAPHRPGRPTAPGSHTRSPRTTDTRSSRQTSTSTRWAPTAPSRSLPPTG